MTPKEKAKELVDRYYKSFYLDLDYLQSKQCALIAVDEILEELTSRGILSGFWYEVKQEIEKL